MNKFQYIAAIIFPLALLYFARGHSHWFVIGLFFYALVYRPILDYYRLKSMNLVERADFYKFFLPFWSLRLRWKGFSQV
jgi:hypothetical protein